MIHPLPLSATENLECMPSLLENLCTSELSLYSFIEWTALPFPCFADVIFLRHLVLEN